MLTIDDVVAQYAGEKPWHEAYIRQLYKWASELPATLVYEVGIHMGLSTNAFLVAAAENGGLVYSCDINPDCTRSVRDPDLRARWMAHITDSEKFARCLTQLASIVYLDGAHDYETVRRELDDFWLLVRPGGMMILHDTNWRPVRDAIHDWQRAWDIYTVDGILMNGGPSFAVIAKGA
jgi:predicted O-methyltransferase YrrM